MLGDFLEEEEPVSSFILVLFVFVFCRLVPQGEGLLRGQDWPQGGWRPHPVSDFQGIRGVAPVGDLTPTLFTVVVIAFPVRAKQPEHWDPAEHYSHTEEELTELLNWCIMGDTQTHFFWRLPA